MYSLLNIPDHIILFLFEFLIYEEKLFVIKCSRLWYHSDLNVSNGVFSVIYDRSSIKLWQEKLQRLKTPPSKVSINVKRYDIIDAHFLDFLSKINYRLNYLFCTPPQFLGIMKSIESLSIKRLSITTWIEEELEDIQEYMDSFLKVIDCQSFSFYVDCEVDSDILTLPPVRSLRLGKINFLSNMTPLENYSHHLHHLSLSECSISDVSMLGSIPHLELKDCPQITDISSLNNNEIIVVKDCESISDYSHSFANSRKINISISDEDIFDKTTRWFDLTRWKRVKHLKLSSLFSSIIRIHGSNQLSPTVQRLTLVGDFIPLINFSVTASHALQELTLHSDKSLKTLTGYGLERVMILELDVLASLQSLDGLGTGKNHQISIISCNRITDFSPLNHLPIVKIMDCSGFTDPQQVRNVPNLTLDLQKKMVFHIPSIPNSPSLNTFSLTILHTEKIKYFDGLENIPYLHVGAEIHKILWTFLETGKVLANRKMVCYHSRGFKKDHSKGSMLMIFLKIHRQFLKDNYDYIIQSKHWIWIRKG